MTQEQEKRGEKMASGVMRALAVIGLVAVLALGAWLIVQGIQLLPRSGGGLQAAVSAVESVFRSAPDEEVNFLLDVRTFPVDEQVGITWEYIGDSKPETYFFSYSCSEGVLLSIKSDDGWSELQCDTSFETVDESLRVIPNSEAKQFADIELTVSIGDLSDVTLVTLVNKGVELNTELSEGGSEGGTTISASTEEDPLLEAVETPSTPTNTHGGNTTTNTTSVVLPEPAVPGPSDLRISIKETGVLVDVSGRDTFFPIAPIPSDRNAAVVFTVANRGGEDSGAWAFKAELPIEGDDDYEYVSPAQDSLRVGAEVEFTLGFDEVLRDSEGTIRIELVPTDEGDKTSNNTDVVQILITEQ